MKFRALLVLGGVGLAGCTVPMPQKDIEQYARMYVQCVGCSQAGLLDQETAAKGMAFVSSNVYRADSERLRASAEMYSRMGGKPTVEFCNSLRLHILAVIAMKENKPATQTQVVSPTNINCFTSYGFTHCNTY